MKNRKIKYQKLLVGILLSCFFASLIPEIFCILVACGLLDALNSNTGGKIDFLNRFGEILSDQQKFIATSQIDSHRMNNGLLLMWLSIFSCAVVALFAMNCISMYQNIYQTLEKAKCNHIECKFKKKNILYEYCPEILTISALIGFAALLLGLPLKQTKNCSQYFLTRYSISLDSLNLSNKQLEQVNKIFEKQSVLLRLFIALIISTCIVAMIAICIAINRGEEYEEIIKMYELSTAPDGLASKPLIMSYVQTGKSHTLEDSAVREFNDNHAHKKKISY